MVRLGEMGIAASSITRGGSANSSAASRPHPVSPIEQQHDDGEPSHHTNGIGGPEMNLYPNLGTGPHI